MPCKAKVQYLCKVETAITIMAFIPTTNRDETQEKVDAIPSQIIFDNFQQSRISPNPLTVCLPWI